MNKENIRIEVNASYQEIFLTMHKAGISLQQIEQALTELIKGGHAALTVKREAEEHNT